MFARQPGTVAITTTPWASQDELLDVYKAIYDFNSPYNQRKALNSIGIWRNRSPKLSLSVECTAALVNLHLTQLPKHLQTSMDLKAATASQPFALPSADTDPLSNFHSGLHVLSSSFPHPNEMRWRFEYGIILLRFVNGIVDVAQKRSNALSVSRLASSIGISRLFVDIRHESTHNDLPSLELLRLAAGKALQWLRVNFWEVQVAAVAALSKAVDAEVRLYRGEAKQMLAAATPQEARALKAYKQLFACEWLDASAMERSAASSPDSLRPLGGARLHTTHAAPSSTVSVALSRARAAAAPGSGLVVDDAAVDQLAGADMCSDVSGGVAARVVGDHVDYTHHTIARTVRMQYEHQRASATPSRRRARSAWSYPVFGAVPSPKDGVPHHGNLFHHPDASGVVDRRMAALQRTVTRTVAAVQSAMALAAQIGGTNKKKVAFDSSQCTVSTNNSIFSIATPYTPSTAAVPTSYHPEAVQGALRAVPAPAQGPGEALVDVDVETFMTAPVPMVPASSTLPLSSEETAALRVRANDNIDSDLEDAAPAPAYRLVLAREASLLARQHATLALTAPSDQQAWSTQCAAAALRASLVVNHLRNAYTQAAAVVATSGNPAIVAQLMPWPQEMGLSATDAGSSATLHPFAVSTGAHSPADLARLVYAFNTATHTLLARLELDTSALTADAPLFDYLTSLATGPAARFAAPTPTRSLTVSAPVLPVDAVLCSAFKALEPGGHSDAEPAQLAASFPPTLAKRLCALAHAAAGLSCSAGHMLPPLLPGVDRLLYSVLPAVLVSKAHLLKLPALPQTLALSHVNIGRVLAKQAPAWMPLIRYFSATYPKFQAAMLWCLLHRLVALQEQWVPPVDADMHLAVHPHAAWSQRCEYSSYEGLYVNEAALRMRSYRNREPQPQPQPQPQSPPQSQSPQEDVTSEQPIMLRGARYLTHHAADLHTWDAEMDAARVAQPGTGWPSALVLRPLPAEVRWLCAVIVEWVALLAAPLTLPSQANGGAAKLYYQVELGAAPEQSTNASQPNATSDSAPGSTTAPTADLSSPGAACAALHLSPLPSLPHLGPLTQLSTLNTANLSALAATRAEQAVAPRYPASPYMDWLAVALFLDNNDGPMAAALTDRLPALRDACAWIRQQQGSVSVSPSVSSASPGSSATAGAADGSMADESSDDASTPPAKRQRRAVTDSISPASSSASSASAAPPAAPWRRCSIWAPAMLGTLPGGRYPLFPPVRPAKGMQPAASPMTAEYAQLVGRLRSRFTFADDTTAPTPTSLDCIISSSDAEFRLKNFPEYEPPRRVKQRRAARADKQADSPSAADADAATGEGDVTPGGESADAEMPDEAGGAEAASEADTPTAACSDTVAAANCAGQPADASQVASLTAAEQVELQTVLAEALADDPAGCGEEVTVSSVLDAEAALAPASPPAPAAATGSGDAALGMGYVDSEPSSTVCPDSAAGIVADAPAAATEYLHVLPDASVPTSTPLDEETSSSKSEEPQ